MNYCDCNGPYTSGTQRLEVKPGDRNAQTLMIEVTALRNSPSIDIYNSGPGTAQLTIQAVTKGVTSTIPLSPNTTIQDLRFFAEDFINFELVGTNTTAYVEITTPY